MLDYRQLEALAAVLEEGSFEKAALLLCITQSAVSQRIRQLEERVGHLLVVRANPLYPTDEGRGLLSHFKRVRYLESEVMSQLPGGARAGFQRLQIAVNADSLATWFLAAVSDIAASERVLLDIVVDDQDQTHHLLKKGEVLGCVSTQETSIQGSTVSYLGTMDYACFAAPAFASKYFSKGLDRLSLLSAPAVVYGRKDELLHRYLKRYFDIEQGQHPTHAVPSTESYVEMAASGLAYALIPRMIARKRMGRGELVALAPDLHLDVHLYWHGWNMQSEQAGRLCDVLVKRASELLPRPLDIEAGTLLKSK